MPSHRSHRGLGWMLAAGVASSSLASCADDAPSPRDASVAADHPADVAQPADLGRDAGAGDGGARDVPGADRAADDVPRLQIPVDPRGLPSPGSECTGDAGARLGDPSVAPPRPVVPQSVSRVTSQRPSFRWALPEGTTGARVEVCADRCCTRVLATLDAEGTTVRPPSALPPGVVYWRLFGRRAGATGSRPSATWEFGVRRRDTPVDSSWGTIRDFTGDGYDDLVLFVGTDIYGQRALVYLVEGSAEGPRPARSRGSAPMAAAPWTRVGDFDGDGRADLAYLDPPSSPTKSINVLAGQPTGLWPVRRLDVSSTPFATFSTPAVTDWNGDGYSDLVVSVYHHGGSDIPESRLLVYHGSPAGLGTLPQEMHPFGPPIARRWVVTHYELGDLDLDGYGDLFVEDLEIGRSDAGKFFLHGSNGAALRVQVLPDPPVEFESRLHTDLAYPNPVGDVDGDGRMDFVAFFPLTNTDLFLYRNAPGFEAPPTRIRSPGSLGADVHDAGFGFGTAGGDLNGDGYADLLVAASDAYTETWMATTFPFNSGRLYIYFGQPSGLAADPIWFDRARPTDPDDNPSGFAADFALPGDLDGDGIDDVAIFDLSRGRICHVSGSPSLASAHLSDCSTFPGRWARIF